MFREHSTQRVGGAALALALAVCAAAQAADSVWLDFESRIQYAYYDEDRRALLNILEQLEARPGNDSSRRYYIALTQYRLAHSAATPAAERADSVERCVAILDRTLDSQADSVEALTLQAACLDTLGNLKPLRAPLALSRSRAHLARALELAPANPRALLISAMTQVDAASLAALRQSIRSFETERQGMASTPGWGAADAYVELGRACLNSGEVLAARDALERALLIAPEHAGARKLLTPITSK